MYQLKCDRIEVRKEAILVVARDDRPMVPEFLYVWIHGEWLLSDEFAAMLLQARRKLLAREAEADPLSCDVAMF